MAVPGVYEQSGRVILGTTRGALSLDPSGELNTVTGSSEAAFGDFGGNPGATEGTDDDSTTTPSPRAGVRLLGARPLEVAALRGIPESPDRPLWSLQTVPSLAWTWRTAACSNRRSTPTAAGRFVSGDPSSLRSGLRVLAKTTARRRFTAYAAKPFGLSRVLSFAEPRAVAAAGNGAPLDVPWTVSGVPGVVVVERRSDVLPSHGCRSRKGNSRARRHRRGASRDAR